MQHLSLGRIFTSILNKKPELDIFAQANVKMTLCLFQNNFQSVLLPSKTRCEYKTKTT